MNIEPRLGVVNLKNLIDTQHKRLRCESESALRDFSNQNSVIVLK